MKKKKEKIIFTSKPTFGYYLFASSFLIMFFLVDDSYDIFKDWTIANLKWLEKLFCVFIFFGIPTLLILSRREIILFEDRIKIYKPGIKQTEIYYLTDLIYWNIERKSVSATSSVTQLTLRFKFKKLTFLEIELTSFEKMQNFLETKYHHKKQDS